MRQVFVRCTDCKAHTTINGSHTNLQKPLTWFLNKLTHKMDCYGTKVDLTEVPEVSEDTQAVEEKA